MTNETSWIWASVDLEDMITGFVDQIITDLATLSETNKQ
jgi:hypothetical protein